MREDCKMGLNALKQIKHIPVDLAEFDLVDALIEKLEQMEIPSSFNARGKQWVVKISCVPVIKDDTEFYPSELFNLMERDGQPCGWSDMGNLQKFLDRMGVSHPEELVEKTVKMRVRRKEDNQYLGFYK